MIVINKLTDTTTSRGKTATITVTDKGYIYFNSACVHLMSLMVGEYIHFINDRDKWFLFSNDDANGYKLHKKSAGAKHINVIIRAIKFTRLFMQSISGNEKQSFCIKPTNIEHDKCPVFEIIIPAKPIIEVLAQTELS